MDLLNHKSVLKMIRAIVMAYDVNAFEMGITFDLDCSDVPDFDTNVSEDSISMELSAARCFGVTFFDFTCEKHKYMNRK